MSALNEAVDVIAGALLRLDQRRHVTPARLELSFVNDPPLQRAWVAQIMADPLRASLAASGGSSELALRALAARVTDLDWRRVKR